MNEGTDRELLEAAAKAAGWQVARWTDDDTALLLVGIQEPWNALHDNQHSDCMGDALRLAVKLRLELSWWRSGVSAESPDHAPVGIQPFNDDPYAATRRAIVRAAAEIGTRGE